MPFDQQITSKVGWMIGIHVDDTSQYSLIPMSPVTVCCGLPASDFGPIVVLPMQDPVLPVFTVLTGVKLEYIRTAAIAAITSGGKNQTSTTRKYENFVKCSLHLFSFFNVIQFYSSLSDSNITLSGTGVVDDAVSRVAILDDDNTTCVTLPSRSVSHMTISLTYQNTSLPDVTFIVSVTDGTCDDVIVYAPVGLIDSYFHTCSLTNQGSDQNFNVCFMHCDCKSFNQNQQCSVFYVYSQKAGIQICDISIL